MINRSVTRVVVREDYNVSEAKREIEELEEKATNTEERARQELASQKHGFMQAAAKYATEARDVCSAEVAQAESMASARHEHTVNLIRRAAEMQLGDQKI